MPASFCENVHPDGSVNRKLPAVIKTADAPIFDPADRKGDAAVHAILIEHANFALTVTEHHETLAEQLGPQRIAIGMRQLLRCADRVPIATHRCPHRRSRAHSRQGFVLGHFHHARLLPAPKRFPQKTIVGVEMSPRTRETTDPSISFRAATSTLVSGSIHE